MSYLVKCLRTVLLSRENRLGEAAINSLEVSDRVAWSSGFQKPKMTDLTYQIRDYFLNTPKV